MRMRPMSFRDRWVLVTGASSGLGRAMAVKLAKEHGANILAVARRADRLDALRDEVTTTCGARVHTILADLSQPDEVERVLRQANDGRTLYAAILNAGVTHMGPHENLEWASFRKMLEVNVASNVRLTTELLPQIERYGEGGGLMLVASLAGLTPVPYQTAYSGTKAFLVHFGCGLWHEMEGRNVSITTYAPSGVQTEMTSGPSFSALRKWLVPVDRAASEGIEALRSRAYLHVPGALFRAGLKLVQMLPDRVVAGRIGAAYRRSLELAAAHDEAARSKSFIV
ncbi:MAG: SDR family NAD(P)-dependent oxidoreductase [Polyangiaceae bacterium]